MAPSTSLKIYASDRPPHFQPKSDVSGTGRRDCYTITIQVSALDHLKSDL